MKTTNRLSVAAAFLLSAALALSCSQVEELEVIEPETPVDEEQVETDAPAVDEGELVPMSFSVTDTKTYVDGKTVKWEEGESIAVYDGFDVREFTMTSLEKLTFEGKISENSTWQWAVYPYSEEGISATEKTVTVSLTPDQKLGAQNVAPGLLLSAGKISDGGVVLKNLTALVSVEVTKSDIASVVVEGAAVAGTATFSEDGTLASVAEGSSASAVLKPASDAFAAGTYYVAVLPGLSESDVKVSVVREDGYKGTKTVPALQLLRNKIYSAGQLDKTVEEWVYEVPDAAALLKWHSGHSLNWSNSVTENYPEDKHKVLLTGDIDLDGKTWNYKHLRCEFDGAGHKIYNVVIERASNVHFFNILYADIHDVIFGSKDGQTYDGKSKIESTYKDGGTGNNYIGLFLQTSPGEVEIKNVTSFIPITVPATANGRFRAAGLICKGTTNEVGYTTRIEGCKTYGKVSILHTNAAEGVSIISGMVGIADLAANSTNKLEIVNCENHADIEVLQPRVEAIGGVLGERFGNADTKYLYLTMTGCKNYGEITHTNSTANDRSSIGGIVGKAVESSVVKDNESNYYVKIENCENGKSGATSASVTSNGKSYCLGGVAGWISGVSMTGCKNYGAVTAIDLAQTGDNNNQASNTVGGIAGNVAKVVNDGTAGNSDKLTVLNNCRNEGAVYAKFMINRSGNGTGVSGAAVGGIAGSVRSIAEFKNNDNVGDVTGINTCAGLYVFAGGIAAHVHCSNGEGSFYGCRNAGTIKAGGVSSEQTASIGLGGVVGKLQANIYSCANYGAVIREYAANSNAGSVVGMTRSSATVKDCIARGTVDGVTATTDAFAVKDAQGATVSGTKFIGDRPSDL